MATLHATIPDDLQRQVQAVARARGVAVRLVVDEALRCIVAPEPFASEAEAQGRWGSTSDELVVNCTP